MKKYPLFHRILQQIFLAVFIACNCLVRKKKAGRRIFFTTIVAKEVTTNILPVHSHTVLVKVVTVTLKLPKKCDPFIAYVLSVLAAIDANPTIFATPVPATVDVRSECTTLQGLQNLAKLRTKGAVQDRNTQMAVVKNMMIQLRNYVQGLVIASPSEGREICLAANMSPKITTIRQKQVFSVKTAGTGAVELTASRIAVREAHQWDCSKDGTTWFTMDVPPTLEAKTIISDLLVNTLYYFRHRHIIKGGVTVWDPTITFRVV